MMTGLESSDNESKKKIVHKTPQEIIEEKKAIRKNKRQEMIDLEYWEMEETQKKKNTKFFTHDEVKKM
jgi:hypothetical protein